MTLYEGATLKTCTHCGRTFPATREYWVVQRAAPSGFRADCRDCHGRAVLEYRKRPERRIVNREYEKRWRKQQRREHPEKYLKAETIRRRKLREQGLAICGHCKRTWPFTEDFFPRNNGELSRFHCHFCNREAARDSRQRARAAAARTERAR